MECETSPRGKGKERKHKICGEGCRLHPLRKDIPASAALEGEAYKWNAFRVHKRGEGKKGECDHKRGGQGELYRLDTFTGLWCGPKPLSRRKKRGEKNFGGAKGKRGRSHGKGRWIRMGGDPPLETQQWQKKRPHRCFFLGGILLGGRGERGVRRGKNNNRQRGGYIEIERSLSPTKDLKG